MYFCLCWQSHCSLKWYSVKEALCSYCLWKKFWSSQWSQMLSSEETEKHNYDLCFHSVFMESDYHYLSLCYFSFTSPHPSKKKWMKRSHKEKGEGKMTVYFNWADTGKWRQKNTKLRVHWERVNGFFLTIHRNHIIPYCYQWKKCLQIISGQQMRTKANYPDWSGNLETPPLFP